MCVCIYIYIHMLPAWVHRCMDPKFERPSPEPGKPTTLAVRPRRTTASSSRLPGRGAKHQNGDKHDKLQKHYRLLLKAVMAPSGCCCTMWCLAACCDEDLASHSGSSQEDKQLGRDEQARNDIQYALITALRNIP